MIRRGFTMIELVIAVALTAMVVGVVAGMFGFASVRLSDSYTQSSLSDQVNAVADSIEATIRNAHICAVADGGATLICSMPSRGIDTDGDGMDDTYYPNSVNSQGVEQYTVGSYVWYYAGASNGTYNRSTTGLIWRADRANTGAPTSADIDTKYMYYMGGGRLRYPLVTSIVCTVNAAARSVTYTVTGSSRIGSQSTETSDTAGSRFGAITRTVQWRD